MKATNKQEFFDLLGAELRRIGIEDDGEIGDIFADFEEHFTDGAMRGTPEDVTAERLGDIKEIARSYLNLESSRINSIMARDVERRRVSLTKPGRGVPADLSLIGNGSARDIANSDNIREYTPQHLTSEIYPQSAPNSSQIYGNSAGNFAGAANNQSNSANMYQNMGQNTGAGYSGADQYQNAGAASAGPAAASAGNKSVADAFSDAGKAALDAAKITGHAVADAFKQSGVKQAVVGAGKTAADAVKSAGEAVKQAVKPHGKNSKSKGYNGTVPKPSDTYRENMNTVNSGTSPNSRRAEIPQQYNQGKAAKNKKDGYKLIDISSLKPNVNSGKLVLAVLLDVFVWDWLVPTFIAGLLSLFYFGTLEMVIKSFNTVFGSFGQQYFMISRLFLGFTLFWLGIALLCVVVFFAQLFIRLIKFIINLHIKAIYDL